MTRSFVGFVLASLLGLTGFDWWLHVRPSTDRSTRPVTAPATAAPGYHSMEGGGGFPPPCCR
jgi:hypothetical protein